MNRQDIHRGFLARLLALRDEDELVRHVRLVARLYHDEWLGGADVDNAFVFIPDLHLTSARAEKAFQYGFRKLRRGRNVARDEILGGLGQRLLAFRDAFPAGQNLNVIMLGDLLDLWRERPGPGEDVTSMVRRILAEFPRLEDQFVSQGSQSLLPWHILGNHELWEEEGLSDSNLMPQAARSQVLTIGGVDGVLATHGHCFDPLERSLGDNLQEFFVERFGPLKAGSRYELDRRAGAGNTGPNRGPRGDAPVILRDVDHAETLADWVNVWITDQQASTKDRARSHAYLNAVLKEADALRRGDPAALRLHGLEGFAALTELRAVVIGHSHHARLSIHVDSTAPRNSTVLVDCGAWIESCKFASTRSVPSCQVGILAGGDVRIYQLDPA